MTKRSAEALTAKIQRKLAADPAARAAAVKQAAAKFPFRMMHELGCGGVAFFLQKEPELGAAIMSEWVMYPNGDMPQMDESAKCGACGHNLMPYEIVPQFIRRVQ